MGKREYPDISFQSREKRHKVRKKNKVEKTSSRLIIGRDY